jgi:hypothetical protein
MNPEEIMIAVETAEEQSDETGIDKDLILRWIAQERNSLASVPAGQLIEANIQFRMLDEKQGAQEEKQGQKELDIIGRGLFDRSLIERDFTPVPRPDIDYDEFDPPFSTRCARWACPYGEKETEFLPASQKNQPRDPVTRAIELSDRIYSMTPREILDNYFKLGLTRFPRYLRDFLQATIEDKVKPLLKEVHLWKHRMLFKAEDKHEKEAIKEQARNAVKRINRILLREDPAVQEFNPIIEDQGVQIDKRWTRQEVERLNHCEEKDTTERKENEDWLHKMWTVKADAVADLPQNDPRRKQKAHDGLVKNMSGEEALYLKRNKEEREWREQRIMAWIERQTTRRALERGLQKINQKYRKSVQQCAERQNFSEIRYTGKQRAKLTQAIRDRIEKCQQHSKSSQ